MVVPCKWHTRSSACLRAFRDAASLWQRVIAVALGCVLLAAAVLKLREVLARTAPPAALLDLPSPLAELLIAFEAVLGAWLICGVAVPKARSTALLTFALFAGVSLAAVVAGEPTCGCFGNFEISPIVTCAVDVAAVFALYWTGRAVQLPASSF